MTTVDNIAALSAVSVGSISDGTKYFVRTLRDYFAFASGSTLTADGLTVLTSSAANSRWVRANEPSLTWQHQATWYLFENGNDEADGASDTTPLKTTAELMRRVNKHAANGGYTVYLSGNVETSTPVDLDATGEIINYFYFVGLTTTVATGTLTGATAWNGLTQQEAVITASMPGGWTQHVGRLMKITSGPRAGAQAWIVKDLGGNFAMTSPVASAPFVMGLGTMAATDPFEIVTLPRYGDVTWARGKIEIDFQNVDLGAVGIHKISLAGQHFLDGCITNGLDVDGNGNAILTACRLLGGGRAQLVSRLQVDNCWSDGGAENRGIGARPQAYVAMSNTLFTSGAISIDPTGVIFVSGDSSIGFFDVTGSIFVQQGAVLKADGMIWGKNVAGTSTFGRMTIYPGGSVYFLNSSSIAISGSGTELTVGNAKKTFFEVCNNSQGFFNSTNGAKIVASY